jgi:hypothetical protein
MSVNDAAGLPVLEVFADSHVVAGRYGQNDFYIDTGGNIGLGDSTPSTKLHVAGKVTIDTIDTDASLTNFLVVDGNGEIHKRTSGADGTSGSSGSSGNNGNNGTSGSSGNNGNNGNNGTSGSSGSSGNNGNNGTSGSSGNNGNNGNNGTSGSSGSSGNNGNNGTGS